MFPTEIEYAVMNKGKKVVFKSNDEAVARARRDRMNPAWTLLKATTTFEEIV